MQGHGGDAELVLILEGVAAPSGVGDAAMGGMGAAGKTAGRVVRSWAACLGRIFEVNPIKCGACGGVMQAIAVIRDDYKLGRLLGHMGIETDYPKTKPARSPPKSGGEEETQWNPEAERWDGVDEERAEV